MNTSIPHAIAQWLPASPQWRAAWLAVAVSLALVAAAYWNTFASIVSIWSRSGTFTHGFLIVPIVVFLVWQQRAELQQLTPRPAPIALLFLAGLVLLWCAARLLDVNVAQHFAVVMMIPATLWSLLGSAVMKRLAFPMAYLLFAVPFGEFLVPTLQDITATITVKALQFTGIPVLWEGRYFYIPSGSFEVAEACSGVRYLIASLALGTLYAYVSYHSLWRRAAFIALSAAVPVIANGVRAYGIVIIAHLSDYKLAVGVDHFIYGWVSFGTVMLLLFWLGNYFRDSPALAATGASAPQLTAVPAVNMGWGWRAVALAILLCGPLLDYMLPRDNLASQAFDLHLPNGIGTWSGPHATVDPWMPKYPGAALQQRIEYRRNQQTVQVFVAYYAQERQGAELVNSENVLFDRRKERRLGEAVETIALDDGTPWAVRALRIHTEHGERLIWSWYVVAGQSTANPIIAKLYEARTRVFGTGSGSALIALATDDAEDLQVGRARLQDFLNSLRKPLNASVGGE